MGAGTGTLDTSDDQYEVTLAFTGNNKLSSTSPIYTNFMSALEWLISGLQSVGASGSCQEIADNGTITAIKVTVRGPLYGSDRRNFNRAFNRLLWGFRHKKSPNKPSDSGWTVTPSNTDYIDEET